MRNKILVIGSSNTDMTVKTDRLPVPGETVLGGKFVMGGGGKGANQAVAAARLGGDVEFVCKVGDDIFGRQALEHYREEGIAVENCMLSSAASGIALITVDSSGENCIVVASGANADVSVRDIDRLAGSIKESGILLLQLEIPVEAVLRAAEIAYSAGVYVVLNPAPACELPEDLFKYVSLIIPNETELSLMTGIDCSDRSGAERAAGALKEKGVKNVVVTMGSKGALVLSEGAEDFVPARKVEAIDTTAAGDTFCGGVCVALSEGKDLLSSVRFATAASSLSVQKMGAQDSVPMRVDVDAIL